MSNLQGSIVTNIFNVIESIFHIHVLIIIFIEYSMHSFHVTGFYEVKGKMNSKKN